MGSSLAWLSSPWGRSLLSLLGLALAVAGALVVHAIAFALLHRLAAKPQRVVEASLYRHARRPARWLLLLLALLVALPLVPLPELARLALQHVVSLGVIAACAWGVILATEVLADLIASRYRVDVADNLAARRIQTQVHVLRRVVTVVVVLVTLAVMLLTFPAARSIGASLLASAGLAGLVVGMAMRPTLASLIAGIQIALTQPIRLDDAVVVENEYGWIEEITSTYVVVRLWDLRRMVLPLTYFIEHPFQNWTRTTASLIGSVYLYVDYTAPVEAIRQELDRILRASPLWDGQTSALQVTNAKEQTLELRALAGARDAGAAWDLRCALREQLVAFLQANYPQCLPKTRAEILSPASTH